ncbi:hypothetical protein FB451DRAFT_1167415 [Mycena latifolia]|nr:hypothetical protein FB451DRAFT_1167415 [Mycena latifolia]
MSAEVHGHLMDVEGECASACRKHLSPGSPACSTAWTAPPCSTWICGAGTQSGHISKGQVRASETSICARERPVEPVERTGTGAPSTGQPVPSPSRQVQPLNPRTDGSEAVDPGRRPVKNGHGLKPYRHLSYGYPIKPNDPSEREAEGGGIRRPLTGGDARGGTTACGASDTVLEGEDDGRQYVRSEGGGRACMRMRGARGVRDGGREEKERPEEELVRSPRYEWPGQGIERGKGRENEREGGEGRSGTNRSQGKEGKEYGYAGGKERAESGERGGREREQHVAEEEGDEEARGDEGRGTGAVRREEGAKAAHVRSEGEGIRASGATHGSGRARRLDKGRARRGMEEPRGVAGQKRGESIRRSMARLAPFFLPCDAYDHRDENRMLLAYAPTPTPVPRTDRKKVKDKGRKAEAGASRICGATTRLGWQHHASSGRDGTLPRLPPSYIPPIARTRWRRCPSALLSAHGGVRGLHRRAFHSNDAQCALHGSARADPPEHASTYGNDPAPPIGRASHATAPGEGGGTQGGRKWSVVGLHTAQVAPSRPPLRQRGNAHVRDARCTNDKTGGEGEGWAEDRRIGRNGDRVGRDMKELTQKKRAGAVEKSAQCRPQPQREGRHSISTPYSVQQRRKGFRCTTGRGVRGPPPSRTPAGANCDARRSVKLGGVENDDMLEGRWAGVVVTETMKRGTVTHIGSVRLRFKPPRERREMMESRMAIISSVQFGSLSFALFWAAFNSAQSLAALTETWREGGSLQASNRAEYAHRDGRTKYARTRKTIFKIRYGDLGAVTVRYALTLWLLRLDHGATLQACTLACSVARAMVRVGVPTFYVFGQHSFNPGRFYW